MSKSKVISSLNKLIKLLESFICFNKEGEYQVINEITGDKVFEGTWDECTDYVDKHTPDESNSTSFSYIIESIKD